MRKLVESFSKRQRLADDDDDNGCIIIEGFGTETNWYSRNLPAGISKWKTFSVQGRKSDTQYLIDWLSYMWKIFEESCEILEKGLLKQK